MGKIESYFPFPTRKKKKEEKRLQKASVNDSQPQDGQPISGNDDKAVPTGDL
jgi:hypothetical protein